MELDQIRAFLAIARKGSFSKAARDMRLTQPAVSIKIRRLEEELGHPLLERRPRGVALTPAGEIVRRRGEQILVELATLEAELGDLSDRRTGRVALGASDTVCIYLIPEIVRRFAGKYPGIELQLFTQISRRVLDLILDDQVDIGIVTLPAEAPGVEVRELYADRFVPVFPPGHPLQKRASVRPKDLRAWPIIHLKPETLTRRWLDGILAPHGLKDQIRLEVSTIEVIKRLVEAGLGISLLPQMAVAEDLEAGRLGTARLLNLELRRGMGLAYRRDKYFSLALSAFIDELTAHTESLRQRIAKS